MIKAIEKKPLVLHIKASCRIVLATMVFCCIFYTATILLVGSLLMPSTAKGSLIYNKQGEIIGSEYLAQGFSRPEYFWPRPSAAGYNASAACGSNLSSTNPRLRARAEEIIAVMEGAGEQPVPADMVTASGSGLDPHITLHAAEYQAARVAAARGLPVSTVLTILARHARQPGGVLTPEPLVPVLLVNLALDRRER